MSQNRHLPVLLAQTLESFDFIDQSEKKVVDCTLGGAGHSFALLQRFPKLKLLGCDFDENAISLAKQRLSGFIREERFAPFYGSFAQLLTTRVEDFPIGYGPAWDGVLLDLGYSSNQLENPEFGMSFMSEAKLDMRLRFPHDPNQLSAWDLLEQLSVAELSDIFKHYGEMPDAAHVARCIKADVDAKKTLNSTRALAQSIERIRGSKKESSIHPATVVFQALRIAVNDELRVLNDFLNGILHKLKPEARVAIITFHSLEDRIVKRWGQNNAANVEPISKKPFTATQEEINANPRSRSAKLRVYRVSGTQ